MSRKKKKNRLTPEPMRIIGCLNNVRTVTPHCKENGKFDEPRQIDHVREEFREFIDAYNDGIKGGWTEEQERHFCEEGIDLITVTATELKAHFDERQAGSGVYCIVETITEVNEKNTRRHYFEQCHFD